MSLPNKRLQTDSPEPENVLVANSQNLACS